MSNKFYIQSGYNGPEVSHVMFSLPRENLKFSAISNWLGEPIIGSVEFVEQFIGQRVPNYYPSFLKEYFNRKIEFIESISEIDNGECRFVKPADRHKRFDARIVSGCDKYESPLWAWQMGPYWSSEITFFEEEYRYYVANGKVLCAYWYIGLEKRTDPPELDINWPDNFCGAVDFGIDRYGRVSLVENNLPYACGWYGPLKDARLFIEWLKCGMEFLTNSTPSSFCEEVENNKNKHPLGVFGTEKFLRNAKHRV